MENRLNCLFSEFFSIFLTRRFEMYFSTTVSRAFDRSVFPWSKRLARFIPNDFSIRLIFHVNGTSTVYVHIILQSSLSRAYESVHKCDIICLSETYLDSSIDDENFEISGYYLIPSDHPTNKRRGSICIYYKNLLPLKLTGVRPLDECIAFDLIISNKLCSFVALYRSPSQSQDYFATFSDNFEMTLDLVSKKNPFLLVVFGDYSAKLSQWDGKDSSTSEGISVKNITSQFGIYQIINEFTHILKNSSSCIDVIFTSRPVESGTQP